MRLSSELCLGGAYMGLLVCALLPSSAALLRDLPPANGRCVRVNEKPQRNPSVARPGHPSVAGSGDRRADGYLCATKPRREGA
jgi:hypothetical protein